MTFFQENENENSMGRLLTFICASTGVVTVICGLVMCFLTLAPGKEVVYIGAGLLITSIGGKALTRATENTNDNK